MIGQDMLNRLYDCQVIDPEGEKIGSVKRIWLDGATGDPVWASVHTGLFGLRETFVPLQRAELHDDRLQVPVGKAKVKEAPRIEAEGDQMSDEEQQTLYRYYGVSPSDGVGGQRGKGDRQGMNQPGSVQRSAAGGRQGTGQQSGVDQRRDAGQRAGMGQRGTGQAGIDQRDAGQEAGMGRREAGQAGNGQRDARQEAGIGQRGTGQETGMGRRGTGRGDGAGQLAGDLTGSDARQGSGGEGMTRSEERLRVGTEQVETGRVRLVKHVVTEEQQVSVPVSHEEVRIEREPVTDASRMAKVEISEGEQEIRLHAEKAVVSKETVPVERVRLAKDTITEQETVSGEVRKEQIDIKDDQATGHRKQPPAR